MRITTIVLLTAFTIGILLGWTMLGFGSARGQSQYTGYVVDTEIDKGVVFRTSQFIVKTDPRSSTHEEFCLTSEEMEKKAVQLQDDQERITVQYSRPLFVPVWKCNAGLSIVTDFKEVNPQ